MIKLLILLAKSAKFGKLALTAGTMLLSIGTYAILWGWRFATGFVLLLFAHEMGHVMAARQRGLPVSAPAFIPFVGAYIRMKAQPVSVETEAYVAFAGPFVGSLAAFAVYYAGRNGNDTMLLALAYTGFILNLFNLLPISPLDGGRITAVLSPRIWFFGLPILLGLMIYQPSPMLLLIALIAAPQAWRAFQMRHELEASAYYTVSTETKVEYAALYIGLTALLALMSYEMHEELAGVG